MKPELKQAIIARLQNLETNFYHLDYRAQQYAANPLNLGPIATICQDDLNDIEDLTPFQTLNSIESQIAMYAGCTELPKQLLLNTKNTKLDVLNFAIQAGNETFSNYLLTVHAVRPYPGTLYRAYIADNTNLINLLENKYGLSINKDVLIELAQDRGHKQILARLGLDDSVYNARTYDREAGETKTRHTPGFR